MYLQIQVIATTATPAHHQRFADPAAYSCCVAVTLIVGRVSLLQEHACILSKQPFDSKESPAFRLEMMSTSLRKV